MQEDVSVVPPYPRFRCIDVPTTPSLSKGIYECSVCQKRGRGAWTAEKKNRMSIALLGVLIILNCDYMFGTYLLIHVAQKKTFKIEFALKYICSHLSLLDVLMKTKPFFPFIHILYAALPAQTRTDSQFKNEDSRIHRCQCNEG